MRKEDYKGTKIGIESKIQVKIQKSKIRNHFVFCNATHFFRVFGEAGSDVEFWWERAEKIREEKKGVYEPVSISNSTSLISHLLSSSLSWIQSAFLGPFMSDQQEFVLSKVKKADSLSKPSFYKLMVIWTGFCFS